MKNFYIAISISENGKKYAQTMRVSEDENLITRLHTLRPEIAQICTTKKDAVRIVNHWNACYIANGIHPEAPAATPETPETPPKLCVCERCLMAIESHEGQQATFKIYIDEDDPRHCDWCEEDGFDVLYEIQ